MKNTFFSILAVVFFSLAVNAQSTVDSISSKYKLLPMPEALTIEKTFPALGQYQLNNAGNSAVVITLDSANKGIIWVDGLAEGRIKAYLKKAPGTYRIPVQKSSAGKSISEGTLIYDRDNNVLNIAIGGGYNEADPAAIFPNVAVAAAPEETKVKVKKGSTKTKTKIVFYSAAKLNPAATTAATSEK
jgi:hypothetical protein